MKHTVISILLMICSCDDDQNPPAPVEGISEPDTPSTNCSAYLGCAKLCEESSCVDACAEITMAHVSDCEAERCRRLLVACDEGSELACSELPECGGYDGDIATSGSGSTETQNEESTTT